MDPQKKQALAHLSNHIADFEYETNWSLAADVSGLPRQREMISWFQKARAK